MFRWFVGKRMYDGKFFMPAGHSPLTAVMTWLQSVLLVNQTQAYASCCSPAQREDGTGQHECRPQWKYNRRVWTSPEALPGKLMSINNKKISVLISRQVLSQGRFSVGSNDQRRITGYQKHSCPEQIIWHTSSYVSNDFSEHVCTWLNQLWLQSQGCLAFPNTASFCQRSDGEHEWLEQAALLQELLSISCFCSLALQIKGLVMGLDLYFCFIFKVLFLIILAQIWFHITHSAQSHPKCIFCRLR